MSQGNPLKPTWLTIRLSALPFSYRIDRRAPWVAMLIIAFTLTILVISICYGEYSITPQEVIQTLSGTLPQDHPSYRNFQLVVYTLRLPRIVLAFLVGAALATSGALMQGLTRNPLADPYLLGVSGGAGLVAVALLVWFKNIALYWLPWGAFTGAIITALLIYVLAWRNGGSSPLRFILIGIAIEAVIGAITTMMLLFGKIHDVQQAYVWLTGSVHGRKWEHVHVLAGWLLVFLPLAFVMARSLNTLTLGDDTAKGLGLRVEWQRGILLLVSVALAAVSVSVAGTIGFVGLISPHVTRRFVGPNHEALLPISALFGGALLVLADFIARWVISPSELPIGIITAMIGAPYFLWLLVRHAQR